MTNQVAKGRNIELLAMRLLESEGYLVHRTVRTGGMRGNRWVSLRNDVFGCVDLIAKRGTERTRWIQVTSTRDIGRKKAALNEVPWSREHDSVEVWRWVPGTGKHTDARTGLPRPRRYFQIYHRDEDYRLHRVNRMWLSKVGPEESA